MLDAHTRLGLVGHDFDVLDFGPLVVAGPEDRAP